MVCSGEAPPHLKSLRRLEPFFIRVGRVPTILKTSKPFEKTGRGTVRWKAHDELNLLTSARRGTRMYGGSADALLHGSTGARYTDVRRARGTAVALLHGGTEAHAAAAAIAARTTRYRITTSLPIFASRGAHIAYSSSSASARPLRTVAH